MRVVAMTEVNKMQKAIFITVRRGSTRLPNKCLLKIGGMRTIEYLVRRVKKSKLADIIVLCTTTLKEDEILCKVALQQGLKCFRGPAKDKLVRWLEAAERFAVEFFVTVDGDDLFYEPELIDLAFAQYAKTHPDFIEAQGLIGGAFTYAIKTAALRKVCQIKATDDTEMMWVYFKETGLFRVEELKNAPDIYKRPEIRMTLDYPDDLRFFQTVVAGLGGVKKDLDLKKIIEYLDRNPEVIKINQYLQKDFKINQKRKTKLVLKKDWKEAMRSLKNVT